MIIRRLRLENFGIYAGNNEFELTPIPLASFYRPIVLFRGKNGVGKTTFVEAMRLCLQGNAALGHRVGQQEFDDYLRRRVHRTTGGDQAESASVEIEFDYVTLGKRQAYRVSRTWNVRANRVEKHVELWEDQKKHDDWEPDQCDQFLRELVPPGVLDIFFFDGERIKTLAESGDAGGTLLADTLRSLLGLDMVDQLGRDLDLYIGRQESHGRVAELQRELEKVNAIRNSIQEELVVLQEKHDDLVPAIDALQEEIQIREQELANQGGRYAARREALQAEELALQESITTHIRAVQDLCGGLMPFAVAPGVLTAVSERLERERLHEETQAARKVLEKKLDLLQDKLIADDFWDAIGFHLEPFARGVLFQKLSEDLAELVDGPELSVQDVILRVSSDERQQLLRWIDLAQKNTPLEFVRAIEELNALQEKLSHVQADLARVPDTESIQELVTGLSSLNQQAGAKCAELDSLRRRIEIQESRLRHYDAQRERVLDQIEEREKDTSRLYLATRTQQLLEAYKAKLAQHKIAQIEKLLARRFNQLCRKETFLDRVRIDPESFQVTLYRLGQRFERKQLSAGENQLFATATLWALREVSRRPMPVVIDTPLSRLDSDHRLKMIREFYPHTSHQLIVLATDAEFDDETVARLYPAISHIYEMQYKEETQSLHYVRKDNTDVPPQLIRAEEVEAA